MRVCVLWQNDPGIYTKWEKVNDQKKYIFAHEKRKEIECFCKSTCRMKERMSAWMNEWMDECAIYISHRISIIFNTQSFASHLFFSNTPYNTEYYSLRIQISPWHTNSAVTFFKCSTFFIFWSNIYGYSYYLFWFVSLKVCNSELIFVFYLVARARIHTHFSALRKWWWLREHFDTTFSVAYSTPFCLNRFFQRNMNYKHLADTFLQPSRWLLLLLWLEKYVKWQRMGQMNSNANICVCLPS